MSECHIFCDNKGLVWSLMKLLLVPGYWEAEWGLTFLSDRFSWEVDSWRKDSNGRIFNLLLRARVVVRTSNMKISRRRLADLRQNIAPKSVPHVQHDYFSSFSQSNH